MTVNYVLLGNRSRNGLVVDVFGMFPCFISSFVVDWEFTKAALFY